MSANQVTGHLLVREVDPTDPADKIRFPDGTERILGTTLADLVERFGGWTGHLASTAYPELEADVDLTPWRERNPQTTFIRLGWEINDPAGNQMPASDYGAMLQQRFND